MNLKKNIFIASFIVLTGCMSESYEREKQLKELDFLLGTWQYSKGDTLFIEKWQMENAEKMDGLGIMVINKDTTILEKLTILFEKSEMNYVADVVGNDSKVSFKMVKSIPNNFLFKNEMHDFPKTINYIFNETGYLYAKLEGKIKDVRVKKEFFFEKIKGN